MCRPKESLLGDRDRDGDLDVFVADMFSGPHVVWFNDTKLGREVGRQIYEGSGVVGIAGRESISSGLPFFDQRINNIATTA